jgi:hypothetical protein
MQLPALWCGFVLDAALILQQFLVDLHVLGLDCAAGWVKGTAEFYLLLRWVGFLL